MNTRHPTIDSLLNGEPTPRPYYNEDVENDEREVGNILKIGVPATVLATVAFFLLSPDTGGSDDPEKYGERNPYIASVALHEGARIRHDPVVMIGPDEAFNLIDTLQSEVVISTPAGVYETHDNNGTWYGIDSDMLPDFDDEGDGDDIVWINEKRATPTYTDSDSSVDL